MQLITKGNHFLDKETVLSSTSIRHLPLKRMSFSSANKKLYITSQEFTRLIGSLLSKADKGAQVVASNVISSLGSNTSCVDLIYAILSSHKYRKSKRSFLPENLTKKRIERAISQQRPVELVIPLLPCKVPNKLKSDCLTPDLAEILSLLQLLEICLAIKIVYPPGGVFTVVMDGLRFQDAWSIPQAFIDGYQSKLRKLVDLMGIGHYIKLVDYVKTLESRLSNELKIKREYRRKLAVQEYRDFSRTVEHLAGDNYTKRLELASMLDPDKDKSNVLGRFVPLFQSTMYSVYLPEVYDQPNSENLSLKIFSDIYNIADSAYGKTRKSILEKTWKATLKYMIEVRSDRDIDLLSIVFPSAIRCTIHSKPSQLGLTTINKRTKIESWHGTGYIDSNNKVGAGFRISLETEGYIPVFVKHGLFEEYKQPIFYTNLDKRGLSNLINQQ